MNPFILWLAAGLLSVTTSLAAAGQVLPLDRQQAAELVRVEQYRTPTLIALWSLSCNYCKENLAQLRKVQQRHPRLQLISVASEPLSPEHSALLKQFALKGKHYAYGEDSPEALAFALDPRWHGELPRSLLYDGRGGYRALSGLLSAEQIEQLLDL